MKSNLPIEDRRTKALEFLWIVQAGLLASASAKRRSDIARDSMMVAQYSGSGVFIQIDEAVRAAARIPEELSARLAAEAFCSFYAAPRNEARQEPPYWFARYGEERHDYTLVSKADQFLWTVQTASLANAENQASADSKVGRRERFGPENVIETMAQAVRAASLIPQNVEATEAASDFLAFYCPGMKEKRTPPKWCKAV